MKPYDEKTTLSERLEGMRNDLGEIHLSKEIAELILQWTRLNERTISGYEKLLEDVKGFLEKK